MGRFLLAILLVLAIAGVCDASSRVLLADGLEEQKPNPEKVPSSPPLSPLPKVDFSESIKKSPPTQLNHSSLAASKSEVQNNTEPNSPANPATRGGAENKGAQGSPVKLAPPIGPEKKDLPNGPEKKDPPIGPEKKITPSGSDKKDPPSGTENQHGSPVISAPPSNLETKKPPSSGGGSSPNLENSLDKTQMETCDASSEKCQVEDLVACLKISGNALDELSFLIKNTGENALTVDVKPTPPIAIDVKKIDLAKNMSRKVNIPPTSASSGGKIVLNAGKGDCVLHITPTVSDWKHFQQLAGYATRLTPIYGAYFFVFTMLIAGGTWACCKFRRGRRVNAGIPYQQLEMGTQPQSNSAVVTTASSGDGWDDGWDDDWDEEAVANPSDKQTTGNISLNGLSSRSRNINKDGWDVDWDD
ncbi:uncharacterized protein [Typha latifolia]|uniref:uncharacterized protein n=1 Tax=Typha latifolia TaxID=4733 RepID=UPI003C2B6ABD